MAAALRGTMPRSPQQNGEQPSPKSATDFLFLFIDPPAHLFVPVDDYPKLARRWSGLWAQSRLMSGDVNKKMKI